MLELNAEWEGKIEILCVSLDDDKEKPLKRCEERKWNKVKCLFGGGGFDCDGS